MLKQNMGFLLITNGCQPPSGGCVLKLLVILSLSNILFVQPPSGGCVLKHGIHRVACQNADPAAFGRLCVETATEGSVSVSADSSRLRAAVC